MGGFQVLIQTVGGVEKEYFIPINDADGDNGLLCDDANVQALEHYVGGSLKDYWWSHACGTGTIIGESEIFNANVASTSAGKYFQGSDWLRNQAEFSAFSWVYVTTTGTNQIISETSNLNTGSTRLQFRVDSSNKLSVFYRSAHGLNTVSIADTVDFPLNTWTFVGFSIDCNTDEIALYKNGSQVVFDDSQNPVQCEDLPSATGVQLSSFGLANEVMIGNHTQANLFRRVLTEAEFTSAYSSGVIRCYDLMVQETPSLADSAGSFSLANWAGNVGNEIVNQGSGDITMNNIGSVPFTGTAQIECESYIPSSPLYFYTKDVSPVTPVLTGVTPDSQSAGSNEGVILANGSPSYSYADPSVEHLVEFDNFNPLDVTQIVFISEGVSSISNLSDLENLSLLRLENGSLSSVDGYQNLTSLSYINFKLNDLVGNIDLSKLSNLITIQLQNNLIDSINLGSNAPFSLFDASTNALTQASVDNIINETDTNGVSNGSLNLSGGTNSAPSASSSTALANLIGKGWTVTTN